MAGNTYFYYQLFADKLFKGDIQVTQVGNSVTIPLTIFLMADYKQQLRKNIDLIKPEDWYNPDTDNKYIKEYDRNIDVVCEKYLTYIAININETITFKDKELLRYIKDLGLTAEWFNTISDLIDSIRCIKINSEVRKRDYRKGFTNIDPNTIEYSSSVDNNDIRAYILFNLVFLENRHTIVLTSAKVPTKSGFYNECIMFDSEKLMEFFEAGNSGTVINSSIKSESLESIQDQEWFQALKKSIQEEYDIISLNKKLLQNDLMKMAKHIEKQISSFGKIDFYVCTKNWGLDFIHNIITQTNPKKFYETRKKLPGEYLWYDEKRLPNKWVKRIYKSKVKL